MAVNRRRHHHRNLEEALHHLSSGIILLSRSGEVLFMNAAADAIVGNNSGLACRQGMLTALRRGEANALRRLVDESAASAGNGFVAGGSMKVYSNDGSPMFISVSPLGRSSYTQSEDPAVIVFVTDLDHQIRASQKMLEDFFGITPAEYRVACLLTDGLSTAQIKGVLSIGSETIKSQLASLYRKTGTSRQAQLVRLMLLFCAQTTARARGK